MIRWGRLLPTAGWILLAAQLLAAADTPAELYNRGNDAYAAGDYEAALEAYEGAMRFDVRDPDLYFNAGNAAFKSGRLGWAILHYERARQMEPRREDLRNNLSLARMQVVSPVEIPPPGRLQRLLEGATPDEWAWMAAALHVLTGGLLAIRFGRVSKRGRRALATAAFATGVGLAIVLLPAVYRNYIEPRTPRAVVILSEPGNPSRMTRAGPADTEKELTEVKDGLVVEALRCQGSWCEVALGGAVLGWLPHSELQPIDPSGLSSVPMPDGSPGAY